MSKKTIGKKRKVRLPNPGSPNAVDSGCTCPVLDNGHGSGFKMDGKQCFWVTGGCPLHNTNRTETTNETI